MKITRNGVSFERMDGFNLRPNICSFKDNDGATLNINTITLIQMYKALETALIETHKTTIDEVSARYTKT